MSQVYSRAAWALLADNFAPVFREPDNLHVRAAVQLGACLAGMAIENSMLGAAHALANPLTAHYGIVHGQAVGLMLPHVVQFNAEVANDQYAELSAHCGAGQGGAALADQLTDLLQQAGLSTHLRDCGVELERLPELARDAAQQWTGNFNPRPVDEPSLLELYRQAYYSKLL